MIDAKGGIVIPPFVELHTHFDTALTAGWPSFNRTGTLQEGISIWNKRKKSLTIKDVNERAEQALK
ncbi:cytosine deaminase, partial [Escherichia coli]|nr:cytosine deaminase [Escherichia coli]